MDANGRRRGLAAALAALGVTAAVAVGAGAAVAGAGDGERATAPPPYGKRCAVEFRAYSDGSANIFCAERAKPFAAVDAESGRIRFYR